MAVKRCDRTEVRARMDVILRRLTEGWSVQRVIQECAREWKLTDSTARRYVKRVWESFSRDRGDEYEQARARAIARYERMLEWAYKHAEQDAVRKRILEGPDREGGRDRKLEVTQEVKILSAPLRVLMFASRRLEALDGVDRRLPGPGEKPLGIDVNFPVWTEGPDGTLVRADGEGASAGAASASATQGAEGAAAAAATNGAGTSAPPKGAVA